MSQDARLTGLLEANDRFYRVFEELDYAAMEDLWEKSARAFCVHPGWTPLYGDKSVLDSWRRIIGNTDSMRFELSRIEARVEGNLGIVTLFERIYTVVDHERHTGSAVSTNLFVFDADAGRWKIFHHHASHAPLPDEEESGPLN